MFLILYWVDSLQGLKILIGELLTQNQIRFEIWRLSRILPDLFYSIAFHFASLKHLSLSLVSILNQMVIHICNVLSCQFVLEQLG